jgi:putative DNA primase/helicase
VSASPPGLQPEHVDMLNAAAISVDVAVASGARSCTTVDELPEHARWCRIVPGIVFPWRGADGTVVEQYRPDTPVIANGDAPPRKYLWPADTSLVLNVHPAMVERVAADGPLVVVEGTKQHLAAVTAALDQDDVAVVGIAGCYGWVSGGRPLADLGALPWTRPVVIVFDADVATNTAVHAAARKLSDELTMRGAASVKFARLPDGGNAGLDDVLASGPASEAPPQCCPGSSRRPPNCRPHPRGPADRFFGPDGLLVEQLTDELRGDLRLAVDPGDEVMYESGRYMPGHAVRAAIAAKLGDNYRPIHERAAVEVLVAHLAGAGTIITAGAGRAVNVLNGLLDPFTGRLGPHTPDHLSAVQLPVRWQPGAACPTFDWWLQEVTAGRGDDLLEAVALMLDGRGHRQRKAVFLHGPTRSGKSTFIRLVGAVAGSDARSAVTLHDLAGNRFAAADLYGKVLNAANELSAAHVDDLATFKAVTGDDPIRAERKYGQPFTFRNRALFIFAANEIPTVGEASCAYLARIRPFRFPHSYEGRENPAIEARMMTELRGILVRLVEALRRFEARGGYADTDAARAALADFARHSDRVRLFLYEATDPDEGGFIARTELFVTFERWCQVNRRQLLGRHRFFEHVATAGYRPAIRRGVRGFAGLDIRAEADWGAADGLDGHVEADRDAGDAAEPAPHANRETPGQPPGHGPRGAQGAGGPSPRLHEDVDGEGVGEGLVKAGGRNLHLLHPS